MTAATRTIVTVAIRADATLTATEKSRLVRALTDPELTERRLTERRVVRRAYTERQAAQILGVSVPTVGRMKRSGQLRTCRVSQSNRITSESVDAVLAGG